MTATEVYDFAKGCMKSAATSFVEFFTKFLPDLCKAIWDLSKDAYHAATSPGFFASIKGAYESARSMTADVYESIKKDPGQFFNELWNKITDAVGPMVAQYDCLSPQVKVEKICGLIAEWVMPPAILAKVIVRGSKAAKELVELGLIAKLGQSRALSAIEEFEHAPKISLKESRELFNKYKKNGYTLEDFKLMDSRGMLHQINPEELKSLETIDGIDQYERLTGKSKKPKTEQKEKSSKPSVQQKVDPNPQMNAFKLKYSKELKLAPNANRDFIQFMEKDGPTTAKDTLYFDVENSVQKTLNDQVFAEKTAVDSINNSFFEKFNANLRENPELVSRLEGEYKDYKSYRLRLKLNPGDDPKKYEAMLAELYKKTSDEFLHDPLLIDVAKTIPPRIDNIVDPKTWFLAGAGDNALEANMAARSARKTAGEGKPRLTHFREHVGSLNAEVQSIEDIRNALASNKTLIEKKILEKTHDGKIIPSKSMIGILRKIKPNDFSTEADFLKKVAEKTKEIFGTTIDEETSRALAQYFLKVDVLSPPLFATERVVIDLNKANNGLISVDFAGIGVDNIYEQMKSLTLVDYKTGTAESRLHESFQRMQGGVNEVTSQMDQAKDTFSAAIRKLKDEKGKPQFSGDDGIHMPTRALTNEQKTELVHDLSKLGDPAKYRITFVSTHFPGGEVIPAAERSQRIVRAESLEKELRTKIIGADKISEVNAKTFITAIDYVPEKIGGVFNLILSGRNLSGKELKRIEDAFRSSINIDRGEKFGNIIIKTY